MTRLWWTRMTSSSDFSLYSYDCFCDGEHWHYQYVFHASENVMEFPTLSRVKSVPDLLELLSGDKAWRRADNRGLTCKVWNWMHLHASRVSRVFDHDVLTEVEPLTTLCRCLQNVWIYLCIFQSLNFPTSPNCTDLHACSPFFTLPCDRRQRPSWWWVLQPCSPEIWSRVVKSSNSGASSSFSSLWGFFNGPWRAKVRLFCLCVIFCLPWKMMESQWNGQRLCWSFSESWRETDR